jgi:hypothetical protein
MCTDRATERSKPAVFWRSPFLLACLNCIVLVQIVMRSLLRLYFRRADCRTMLLNGFRGDKVGGRVAFLRQDFCLEHNYKVPGALK